MPMLKGKKEQFAQHYTVCYNQTEAAIRAGYAEKSAAKQGCLLMKDHAVLARILEIQQELADRLMLTRERIVLETMKYLEICMAAKPVEEWDYEKHQWVHKGVYKFDSAGVAKALELLGRFLGMFSENRIDPNDNKPVFYTGEEEIRE